MTLIIKRPIDTMNPLTPAAILPVHDDCQHHEQRRHHGIKPPDHQSPARGLAAVHFPPENRVEVE